MWHEIKMLRREGHEMYSMQMKKVSLSTFDNKHWIVDDRKNTYAYGSTD